MKREEYEEWLRKTDPKNLKKKSRVVKEIVQIES